MAGLTITPVTTTQRPIDEDRMGIKSMYAEITFDASYPTGGEAIAASDVGMTVIKGMLIAPSGGYVFEYDKANGKIKVLIGNYDSATDGVLIEEANAADLHALVAFAHIIGY